MLASSTKLYTEEKSVYGLVHEFNQRAKTFELTLPTGEILKGVPAESQHYDSILEAHNGFRNQHRVRVTGIGRFDANSKLLEMVSVEHVVPLDPLDIAVRVDELRGLKRGWFDGKGDSLDPQHLDWIVGAFKNFYPDDAKLPYLYPTPEGNLFAEWSLDSNSVSLEINLSTRSADWHVLNLTTDVEETKQYNLAVPEDWDSIAKSIKAMGGVSE